MKIKTAVRDLFPSEQIGILKQIIFLMSTMTPKD